MKIAIVTDSTCDLSPDVVQERRITVTPEHILWGDENLTDGVDISTEGVYERLGKDPILPKTSQPSSGEFAEKFREAREKQAADAVLCITLSNDLSGTFTSARAACNLVDFPVHVVDSRTVTIALGFAVLAAADALDRGASVEEAATVASEAGKRSKVLFTLNTLEFLHRGGRIGGASRFIGTALNIKPILQIKDGIVGTLESVRTRKKAVARMVQIVTEQTWERPLCVGVLHAQSPELEEVAYELKAALKPECFMISVIAAAIGVHTGPGTLGVGILPAK